MGTKLYTQDENGVSFDTERKPGEVRIPNYVYDLWLPLVGATAVGVYAVYCRLERDGDVKGISLADIASACRIGTDKLNEINKLLVSCKFIKIKKPVGQERTMHWTTRITTLDPPREISKELIGENEPPSGYKPLTPWLVAPENLGGFSGEPIQVVEENPSGSSNIATLELQPVEIAQAATPPQSSHADLGKEHKTKIHYYEDVEFIGGGLKSKKKGPWSLECGCGRSIRIENANDVVVCRECAIEHIVITTRPAITKRRKPLVVDAYYQSVYSSGIIYGSLPSDLEEKIISTVSEDDIPRWKLVITEYIANGWSPKNVPLMLSYYKENRLPDKSQKRKEKEMAQEKRVKKVNGPVETITVRNPFTHEIIAHGRVVNVPTSELSDGSR